jgi:hypothetical protein
VFLTKCLRAKVLKLTKNKEMNKEQRESLETLMKAPIMLAACLDALEKGIQLHRPEKIDALIDDLESAVPILEEWAKGSLLEGSCLKCKFWDQFHYDSATNESTGCCARHAPRPSLGIPSIDGEENVVWPITRGNEICGDFIDVGESVLRERCRG